MIRLKELRLKSGRTQAQVAAELGTNQQTYARWENGKSEPPHAALAKMPVVFDATFDYIFGRDAPAGVLRNLPPKEKKSARYWGDLGLRPRGSSRTFGFPLSDKQATRVEQRLEAGEKLPDWITVETMNNRVLAFRPKQMRESWLIEDADEFPEEFHYPSPLDGPAGLPLEVYRAMADWVDRCEGGDDVFSDHPKALQKSAVAVIERAGFIKNPGALDRLLRSTVVHYVGGETKAHDVDPEDLASAMFHIEHSKGLDFLVFSGRENNFRLSLTLEDVALIEFPAIELEMVWEKERREYEA